MDSKLGFGRWQSQVARSSDLQGLRRALLASADGIGTTLSELKQTRRQVGKPLARRRLDEWQLIGVDVQSADIGSSGASKFQQDHHLVLVRASDSPLRQRFTVAHEIGHFILSHPERSIRLSKKQEEAMCDEFASRLLLPRASVLSFLNQFSQAPSTIEVLGACRSFEVGLQPMLIALREHLRLKDPVYVVASHRGHRLRPEVLDFRIDASASPGPFYLANDQRLASVGLQDLAFAAADSVQNSYGAGGTDAFTVKLWDRERGRSGHAQGPATWEFTRLRNGPLLARVCPGQMTLSWASGRKEQFHDRAEVRSV